MNIYIILGKVHAVLHLKCANVFSHWRVFPFWRLHRLCWKGKSTSSSSPRRCFARPFQLVFPANWPSSSLTDARVADCRHCALLSDYGSSAGLLWSFQPPWTKRLLCPLNRDTFCMSGRTWRSVLRHIRPTAMWSSSEWETFVPSRHRTFCFSFEPHQAQCLTAHLHSFCLTAILFPFLICFVLRRIAKYSCQPTYVVCALEHDLQLSLPGSYGQFERLERIAAFERTAVRHAKSYCI